ncbi:3-dehydroquinate synthase [Anaerocolumna cellulosilytica]|uniref:3-dehydroquinate synthase n=1 Tax=Anaerocolumna cellulosilytica TaxID=433286 RepID=A0A6S6R6D7_9FIRM|nr:3-dehydroquinate synthase [Anaerocolumna cellulosilytica]MBB5193761.1 3-dehydroquinate synthase [Anaerocolumna cellulosilytica]BCJ95022.1 3-dehydroquinate synthase [Anaerocolumna cellulosilytica]
MNNIITVNYEDKPIYDITLEYNYNMLCRELNKLGTSRKKVCIVTDSNLSRHYLNELIELLKDYAKVVETFTFPAGENSKNLGTVQELYNRLIQSNFDRKDLLVALGGGVVGDLTGYAAATYLRGIQFIQLPTSLLAMVDSSIGGKTGVDFQDYKNMIGAFHQPAAVYMNLSTLYSLSDVQYYSGLGEIIKYGLIKDRSYYSWLKKNIDSIKNREPDSLRELVYKSCRIKQEVVEKDPKEQGERALLNFGHTIGHAIEKLMDFKLLHGECVAVGMVAASYLSYKKKWITLEELEDIKVVIKAFELPISVRGLNPNEIYRVTTHDKKMEGNKIKFVLLRCIGEAYIDMDVTQTEILESIQYILEDSF